MSVVQKEDSEEETSSSESSSSESESESESEVSESGCLILLLCGLHIRYYFTPIISY